MAKQGQHKGDGNDPRVSRGHNNPAKSTPMNTGTPKRRSSYDADARARRDTASRPPSAANEWHTHTPHVPGVPRTRGHLSATETAARFDSDLHGRRTDEGHGMAPTHTLADEKAAHVQLSGLSTGDLARIPVLSEGTTLEHGATYVNLGDPDTRPFVATGREIAGPEDMFVPKAGIDYILWNRLTGVSTAERLDESPAP